MRRIPMLSRIVLACLAFSLTGVEAAAQSFAVNDFRDTAGFTYVNIPAVGQALELTRGGAMRPTVGAIWRRVPVPIGGSWTSTITFQILDTGGASDPSGRSGADGLAFVLQLEGPEAIGTSGYGIGYHGIKGGLAVEVDTWDDSAEPEWNGATEDAADHIAIMTNGRQPLSAVPAFSSVAISRVVGDVSSGRIHTLAVRYSPGRLSVYLDDCRTPVLEHDVWLDEWLGSTATIGITAATQSAWQHHRITSWCFTTTGLGCGCPAPCDTLVIEREVHDTLTIHRTDTLYLDRWRDHFDTVYVVTPPDTLIVTRVDTLWRLDTAFVRDTLILVRTDTVRLAQRDTVRLTDTLLITRDTCGTPSLTALDTICGGGTRSMELNLWSTRVVEVAPNPAAHQFAVTFDRGDRGAWSLELFTTTGGRIAMLAGGDDGDVGRYRANVTLGDVPSGRYLLRLRCGSAVDAAELHVRR